MKTKLIFLLLVWLLLRCTQSNKKVEMEKKFYRVDSFWWVACGSKYSEMQQENW